MEIRPSIALVGHITTVLEKGEDHEVGSFVHILNKDLHCNVLPMSLWDPEDLGTLRILHRKQLLMLVATYAGYNDESGDNKEVVTKVHSMIGQDIPVVVFPNDSFQDEGIREVRAHVYSAPMYSRDLHDFIKKLRDQNPGIQNEKRRRAYPEMEALLDAYNFNYPEEDLTYVPDDNTKIVAEYLRCRCLGGEAVAKEFDATLIKPVHIEPAEPNVYKSEISRIRQMSEPEREAFMNDVRTNQGMYKDDWGIWRVEGISRGRFCHPFGINPETMISVMFSGFGGHNIGAIERMMKRRLQAIELMRDGKPTYLVHVDDNVEIKVVPGYVTQYVDPFKTPILELILDDVPDETARKVGQHIISNKSLLPIDNQGILVDLNYTSAIRE